jgi:hypothetical protein
VRFVVCDVAPLKADLNGDGDRFDAGEFGDCEISNADVVAVFAASLLASAQPPAGSDLFAAMDAAAPDEPPACGGDGRLLNNDVVRCFRASLLDTIPSHQRERGAAVCRSTLCGACTNPSVACEVSPVAGRPSRAKRFSTDRRPEELP